MPTAREVAANLRSIADALEAGSDAQIHRPTLSFYHTGYGKNSKEEFFTLARIMPRKLVKGDGWEHKDYTLTHKGDAVEVYASIPKSLTCRLVKPAQEAVYECDPLLSAEDFEEVGR